MKSFGGALLLVGLTTGLVACDAMKLRPYKKEGEAKLAALVAIRDKAKALPALTADRIEPLRLWTSDYGGKRNSVVIHMEELDSLSTYKSVEVRFSEGHEFHFAPAIAMLKGGVLDSEAGIKGAFERLFAIEHVIVMKVTSLQKPKFLGDGLFEPGTVTGEAHVFTLEGAKYHGGVRFTGRSSAKVSSAMKSTESDLLKDLGSVAMSDASRKIKALVPDYH